MEKRRMNDLTLVTAVTCCCPFKCMPNSFTSAESPESDRYGYFAFVGVGMVPIYSVCACLYVNSFEATLDPIFIPPLFSHEWLSVVRPS